MFTFALSYIAAQCSGWDSEGSRCRNPCTVPQHIIHRPLNSQYRVRTTHSHSCLPAPLGTFEERDPITSHPPAYPHPHSVNSLGSQLKHRSLREDFLKGSDQPDPHHTFSQHLCISIDFYNFNELLKCDYLFNECLPCQAIRSMRESAVDWMFVSPKTTLVEILTLSANGEGRGSLESDWVMKVEPSWAGLVSL